MWLFAAIAFLSLPAAAVEVRTAAAETVYVGVALVPPSVVITCDDDTIPKELFEVSPAGTIVFQALPPCDTIDVHFASVADVLPARTRHRLLWGVQTVDVRRRAAEAAAQTPTATFRTSGSLLRGIRISSGGVSSTSSLHFEADGELSGGVHITALLTDEGSPIQPEGRSLELSELDKVLIRAHSRHISASFGDVDVRASSGAFLSVSRRIQGMSANADYERFSAKAFGAMLRGKFFSVEFVASEGNQGPYPLWGEGGERDIVVVAGTERVWLNGEPMTRGENNDYVIDYNLAQITFTNNRPLSEGDRVVVDFQYITEDYPRALFGGFITFDAADGFEISLGAASQRDDEENPSGAISDSTIAFLSGVGDSVPDTLSAPQALEIADISARLRRGAAVLALEYAFSNNDENLFSTIDDGDNFGDAATVSGTLFVLGGAKLFCLGRHISGRFSTLGRVDPADFDRGWALSPKEGADDDIAEAGISVGGGKDFAALRVGARRVGDETAQRCNLNLGHMAQSWEGKLLLSSARGESLRRTTAEASAKLSPAQKLSLEGDLLYELSAAAGGDTALVEAKPKVSLSLGGWSLAAKCGFERKLIRRQRAWGDFYRVVELGGCASTEGFHADYTRRVYISSDAAAGDDQISDLITLRAARKMGRSRISASYQLSRSQSEILNKVYTYVGEGEGSYTWDEELEEYVPDDEGDYTVEYKPTGEFSPVLRSEGSISVSAPLAFVPYGANASFDATFTSENKREGASAYLLLPSQIFSDDSLTIGKFDATLRLNLLRSLPTNLQWTSLFTRSAYRNYASGAELYGRVRHTLTVSSELLWDISAELELSDERTKSLKPTRESWVDGERLSANVSLTRRVLRALHLTAQGGICSIVDRAATPSAKAQQKSAAIYSTALLGKFRLKAQLEWASITQPAETMPYELLGGWLAGENYRWELSVSYRAGVKTELSGIYRGESRGGTVEQSAEARVRLLF